MNIAKMPTSDLVKQTRLCDLVLAGSEPGSVYYYDLLSMRFQMGLELTRRRRRASRAALSIP